MAMCRVLWASNSVERMRGIVLLLLAATFAIVLLTIAEGLALWSLGGFMVSQKAVGSLDVRSISVAPDGSSGAAVVMHSGKLRQPARFEAVRFQLGQSPRIVRLFAAGERPTSIAFSPIDERTVVGCQSGALLLYADRQVREPALLARQADDWISSVEFSPNGRYFSALGRHGLRVWDLERQRDRTIASCGRELMCAAFSADSRRIFTGDSDGRLRAWDVESGIPLAQIANHGDRLYQLAPSPNGDCIATAGEDFQLRLWNIRTGKPLWSRPLSSFPAQPLAFSADGKRLASTAWTPEGRWSVVLWDVASGDRQTRFELDSAAIVAIMFTADGELCVCSNDGTFRRWTTDPPREIERTSLREYF